MVFTGCLIGLILASVGSADFSDPALLERARTAFTHGLQIRREQGDARPSFQEAAHCYRTLATHGVRNAALYRNLGNASLLAGDLPGAILAYRLAMQLAPGDRALRAALDFARAQVAYPESTFARPPSEELPPWLPHVHPRWLLSVAFVSYSLSCLALTRWWILRRGRPLAVAFVCAAITLLLGAGVIVEHRKTELDALHPLVVIADDGVLIRTGNGLSYPPRYETPVNRGVEARLLYVRGNWLQIELAGGEVGWIPAAYALWANI